MSADSGSVAWQVETDDYIHGAPAVADSLVATAGCDGFLRLIDLQAGSEVARIELGTYVGASLAIGDSGRAYVGTFGNEVLGINLVERQVSWRYTAGQRQHPFYASAAVTNAVVAIGGRDRLLHALDPHSGALLWSF